MRALARTVYRRLLLFELRIDGALPSPAGPPGAVVEELSSEGLDDYLGHRPEVSRPAIAARFSRGERCFVVREVGQIVHSLWLAPAGGFVEYLGCRIRLDPAAIYAYDGHTGVEARGRELWGARQTAMLPILRDEGYHLVTALVLPENHGGIRMIVKSAYRPVVRVATWGWGRRRRVRVRPLPAR